MSSRLVPSEKRLRKPTVSQVAGVFFGALLAVSLLGCANAAPFRGLGLSDTEQSHFVGLAPVAQTDPESCGYACVSTVAVYHGVAPERLREDALVKRFGGRPLAAVELVQMAQELGLAAFGFQGSVEKLEDNLSKGRPVIVLLEKRPRVASFPSSAWASEMPHAVLGKAHWVVVVGMTAGGKFVLYDPSQGTLVMAKSALLRSWEKEKRACVLVAVPPKSPE